MHATHHDHSGIDPGRLPREDERIADDVGDAVEDLGGLVVVRQDDRVAFPLETQDGVDVRREDGPLDGWENRLDAVVEMCGAREGDGETRWRTPGLVQPARKTLSFSYAHYAH